MRWSAFCLARGGGCTSTSIRAAGSRSATTSASPTRRSSSTTAGWPTTTSRSEEYAEFCDAALPHLDELAHEWFTGAEFDRLLVDTVRTTFPAHEHEQFVAHYRGLIAAWSRDRPG